jgi:hypothetical protein
MFGKRTAATGFTTLQWPQLFWGHLASRSLLAVSRGKRGSVFLNNWSRFRSCPIVVLDQAGSVSNGGAFFSWVSANAIGS